jgi:hypothetical protein
MRRSRALLAAALSAGLLLGCIRVPTAPGPERDEPDEPDEPTPTSLVVPTPGHPSLPGPSIGLTV